MRTVKAIIGGAILGAAALLSAGCVRSQASYFQEHLSAVVAPSENASPSVALAFGLENRSGGAVAVAAAGDR